MNKKWAIISGIGACGTATVAIGLGVTQSLPKKDESKKLKNKYLSAIPSAKDSSFWSKKNTLFGYLDPTHHLLKQAKIEEKLKRTERSQQLQQQGCKDIYESEDDRYFSDFKFFCSKNNQDVISGTWITNENTDTSNKLNEKLKNLKSYKGELIEELSKVRTSLKSDAPFDKNEREAISGACSTISTKIYMGEGDLTTENAKSFCIN